MRKASAISTATLLLLSVVAARAGPCTEEINNLAKVMVSRDAGSGPTSGAATPRSSASGEAQSGTARQQHPPTATMGKETEGRAASPQDVQRQTAGQPTAAEQSRSGPTQRSMTEALNHARALDQQGKESECMAAVQEAKQAGR